MDKKEYRAITAQLNAISAEILKASHVEIGQTMKEINRCEGHGMFVGTGMFHMVPVFGRDEAKIASLEAKYNELYTEEYVAFEKAEKNKAKERRYRKELEELNKRKAYLEKWLAENTD